MDNYDDIVDRFYDLIANSSILISSNVDYSKTKSYLKFFIKNYFITDDNVEIRNNTIVNAKVLFRKIFYSLNFTDEEKNRLNDMVNDYLYEFIMAIYKNTDSRNLINKKRHFISIAFRGIFNILNISFDIFGYPLLDFFIKFIRKTGILYDDEYANLFYDMLHGDVGESVRKENKFIYDYFEDYLISNWLRYSRVMIERNHIFE